MRNYEKIIEEVNIPEVNLAFVEELDGYDIITLYGGSNGTGYLAIYLKQVHNIIVALSNTYHISVDNIWLIDWINDCPDDVWTLRIGIRNKHDK